MRVLVTGDRGYVGGVLVPLLRASGHEVVGLDAGWCDGCDFGAAPAGYRQLTGDIRDVTPYHLAGFDAVLHLAGISNDPLGDLDPGSTRSINVDGSVHLAETAKAAGVSRFLFASTCAIYGVSDAVAAAEDSAVHPLTAYGQSMVPAEAGISALADGSFSPTHLRGATVYGSSPRLRADIVLNNLVGSALLGGRVELRSDGAAWRPLVHVQDLCAAFLAVLSAPREAVHNTAFNVGREEDVLRVGDIATAVARRLGAPVVSVPGAGPDARTYRVDFARIRSRLPSYRPRWTIAEGIDQLAGDLRRLRVVRDDFDGARFVRLQRVRQLQATGRMGAGLRAEILAV